MKKSSPFFISTMLFLAFSISSCHNKTENNPIEIQFILTVDSLYRDSNVYITGSHQKLDNWNPNTVTMQNNSNTKTFVLRLDSIQQIAYKYTLGTWENEAANPDGTPWQNRTVVAQNDTIHRDTIRFWTHSAKPDFKGQITGTVAYHRSFKGNKLKDRDVIVWLPPGYDAKSEKKYPVLYMHDGQNLFDPATSIFGVDWQIDETCDSMIKNHIIDPLIVVGIYNTPDRSHEYLPGDTAEIYMRWLCETLKPFIDKTYKTKSSREYTYTGGSSAGGTLAFMLSWERSELFSKAICMSPAFKIEHIDYVTTVSEEKNPPENSFFYIDNGDKELEIKLQPGIDKMITTLNKKGYKQNIDYYFKKYPNQNHSESSWAMRFPNAISRICKKKQ